MVNGILEVVFFRLGLRLLCQLPNNIILYILLYIILAWCCIDLLNFLSQHFLLNNSLKKVFCNEEKNRGAIIDRGWNPPNQALLCKEEMTKTTKLSDKMKEEGKAY